MKRAHAVIILVVLFFTGSYVYTQGYAHVKKDPAEFDLPVIHHDFSGLFHSRFSDPELSAAFKACKKALIAGNYAGVEVCAANKTLMEQLYAKHPEDAVRLTEMLTAYQEAKAILMLYGKDGATRTLRYRQALISAEERQTTYIVDSSPDGFLDWSLQFSSECPKCAEATVAAIMPWESLTMRTKTIIARMLGQRTHDKEVPDLASAKAKWCGMSLAQRVRLLGTYANAEMSKFIKGKCGNTKQEECLVNTYFSFASSGRRCDYNEYLSRCDLLDRITEGKEGSALGKPALDKYGRLPLGRRMQELSDYLERSGEKGSELYAKINEMREPLVIPTQAVRSLSSKFTDVMMDELRTTEIGREVAGYYGKGDMKFRLTMAPQSTTYAYYTRNGDKIVLGTALVSEYLRVNGFSVQDMLDSADVRRRFATFVSPVILHEAVHQIQFHLARDAGKVDMYTKMDEDEAFGKEGLYIAERSATDPTYRAMLALTRKYSAYMRGEIGQSRAIRSAPMKLVSDVDKMYPAVNTLPGGRGELVSKIKDILNERAKKSEAAQAKLEAEGLDMQTASTRYPGSDSYYHMKTSVLEDLRELLVTKPEIFKQDEERVWQGVMERRQAFLDSQAK